LQFKQRCITGTVESVELRNKARYVASIFMAIRSIVKEVEMMETTEYPKLRTDDKPLALIAEDAGAQIRLTQLCLERAGCRVIAARDGREALTKIETDHPDLILLDVDMPGINGFQVLDRVRKNPATCAIPVIMLTAHAKDSGLFDEWAGHADVFMTKPFSPEELIATVKRVFAMVTVG
jgi:CheY-like chemotaxis protein